MNQITINIEFPSQWEFDPKCTLDGLTSLLLKVPNLYKKAAKGRQLDMTVVDPGDDAVYEEADWYRKCETRSANEEEILGSTVCTC